ncbi:unnamed protein product [Urochloa humidicola]
MQCRTTPVQQFLGWNNHHHTKLLKDKATLYVSFLTKILQGNCSLPTGGNQANKIAVSSELHQEKLVVNVRRIKMKEGNVILIAWEERGISLGTCSVSMCEYMVDSIPITT